MKRSLLTFLLPVFSSVAVCQTVANLQDSGSGSLRQAITDAASGATVSFDAGLSGQTITLTSGPLGITKDLVIDASSLAAGIAISGDADASGTPSAADSRVIEITGGGHQIVLRHLWIRDGKAGGFPNDVGAGIFNDGSDLTLVACSLSGNSATAGSFAGGGAIYNGVGASLGLHDCTLFDNHGSSGAGIFNYQGTVTLNNCTLTGNVASPDGGGIYNLSGVIEASHTTLTNNSADFGGGIFNGDTLALANSIIAANSATANANIHGSFSGTNNLVAGNPLLAPLGDYGGPTPTCPPLAGSPALGSATGIVAASDQRGVPRPLGSGPDLGAVEMPDGGYEPPRVTRWTMSATTGELTVRWLNTRVSYVIESSSDLTFGEPEDLLIPVHEGNGTIDVETTPGEIEFRFSDPSATGMSYFWRIRSY